MKDHDNTNSIDLNITSILLASFSAILVSYLLSDIPFLSLSDRKPDKPIQIFASIEQKGG